MTNIRENDRLLIDTDNQTKALRHIKELSYTTWSNELAKHVYDCDALTFNGNRNGEKYLTFKFRALSNLPLHLADRPPQ